MRGLFIGGAISGLALGLGIGLALSWFYWPAARMNADLVDLRLDYKDDYQGMIAAAYSLDGDLARAMSRLAELKLAGPASAISARAALESRPLYRQALMRLALDLAQPSAALARPTYTPRPTRTRVSHRLATPVATPVPAATRAPMASPVPATPAPEPALPPPTSIPNPDAPRFVLKSKQPLDCVQSRGRSHIEVEAVDGEGAPLPGVGVEVHWDSGTEILYTGLKPERGPGYADLKVDPGTYSVRLAETAQSDAVENLEIQASTGPCSPRSTQTLGWSLVFTLEENHP